MTEANYKRNICAACGIGFHFHRKKKYCTVRCREEASRIRAGRLSKEEYEKVRRSEARLVACKHCNKTFKPKHSTRITYCSRECAFQHRRENPADSLLKRSYIYAGYCIGCGKPFVAKQHRLHCTERCYASRASIAPLVKQCKCCGEDYKPAFTGGRPSEFCSDKCLSLVGAAIRRVHKAKRHARLRAATIESVDPFKVFDRDKWRCQLCGIRTPKSKRGTYGDNAPELDHIMPLSQGGDHSYKNTQCSCRKCNGLKSGTPRGQALLFG